MTQKPTTTPAVVPLEPDVADYLVMRQAVSRGRLNTAHRRLNLAWPPFPAWDDPELARGYSWLPDEEQHAGRTWLHLHATGRRIPAWPDDIAEPMSEFCEELGLSANGIYAGLQVWPDRIVFSAVATYLQPTTTDAHPRGGGARTGDHPQGREWAELAHRCFIAIVDVDEDDMLVELIRAYHEVNTTWGNLHIVLDDGNWEAQFVTWCIEEAKIEGDVAGAFIGEQLARRTQRERERLLAAAVGVNGGFMPWIAD